MNQETKAGIRTSARLRKRRLQKEEQEEENEKRKTTINTCYRPTPGCNNHDQNDCGILPSE